MNSLLKKLITRRNFIKASGAGALAFTTTTLASCAKPQNRPSKLAIVHTNDTHGHDYLNDESLGLAAAAQLKADYEAKGYEVLLMDAGDIVEGDNLANRTKGTAAIDIFNACGYHAATLGNHEFDYGQDAIMGYLTQAEFPFISANVIVEATGETLVSPNITFTLESGTKIGVFGLTTPETYTKTNPLFVRGLTFHEGEKLYACAQEQADALRAEGCDLVVCLAHLGEADVSAPNRAMDVVAHTTGIDLIIDGHDHREENQLLTNAGGGETLVAETGCYTHSIGVVTWEDGVLSASLASFGSYEGQDEAVATLARERIDEVNAELGTLVATSEFLLDGASNPGVRTKETNLGDLVADAVLWEAQQMADDTPDCVVMVGGAIRTNLGPGDITMGDIVTALPFLNHVATIQLTGGQLLEGLEAACFNTPGPGGGFPQVSGLSFSIDTTVDFVAGGQYPNSTFSSPANPGARVTIHDVGGRGFDPAETYTVAASDFTCYGGDSYYAFSVAAQRTMKTINYLISDCVVYYLSEACNGEVPERYANVEGEGRIEVITG